MESTARMFQHVATNLVQGNIQELLKLADSQGLNEKMSEAIKTIATLFRDSANVSDDYLNHIFFYREIIKKLGKQEKVTQAFLDEQLLIQNQRRLQLLPLIKIMENIEQQGEETELRFQQMRKERMILKRQVETREKEKHVLRQQVEMMNRQLYAAREEKSEMEDNFNQSIIESQQAQLNHQRAEVQKIKNKKYCQELQRQILMLKEIYEKTEQKLQIVKQQNSVLKEKVETFEIQTRSVIMGLEGEGLLRQRTQDSRQSSWISQVTNAHLVSKSELKSKEEKVKNLQDTLKKKEQIIQSKTKEQKNLKTKIKVQKEKLDLNLKTISELQENISQINVKNHSLLGQKKIASQLFVDSSSLITYLGMDSVRGGSFLQTLEKQVGKVESMCSLFNYSHHKGENFHKRVDGKKNIMLICITEQGKMLGGFSSVGFCLRTEQKGIKSFLFGFDSSNKMTINRLKLGRQSTVYDTDFILFGQDQLCIQNGTNELTSERVNGSPQLFHYQTTPIADRQVFISQKAGTADIKLKNYELIELKFA